MTQIGARKFSARPRRGPLRGDSVLVADRARLRDRITVRMRARQLDRALATGSASEKTAALALRARRLTALPRRRVIAQAYRRVLRETREGAPPSYVRIIPSRRGVAAACEELTRLAELLEQAGPISPRGAAQAWLLLTDGTGPLYDPISPADLRRYVAGAIENLTPPAA